MKTVYRADDGKEFDSEIDCRKYEQAQHKQQLLDGFLVEHLVDIADLVWVRDFLLRHSDKIVDILADADKPDQLEWISNEGRNLDYRPDCLLESDEIEVIYRNGKSMINTADNWSCSWQSTDNDPWDIVKYRKI